MNRPHLEALCVSEMREVLDAASRLYEGGP